MFNKKIKFAESYTIPVLFEDGSSKNIILYNYLSPYYISENKATPIIYASEKNKNKFFRINYFNIKEFCEKNIYQNYDFYSDQYVIKYIGEALLETKKKNKDFINNELYFYNIHNDRYIYEAGMGSIIEKINYSEESKIWEILYTNGSTLRLLNEGIKTNYFQGIVDFHSLHYFRGRDDESTVRSYFPVANKIKEYVEINNVRFL